MRAAIAVVLAAFMWLVVPSLASAHDYTANTAHPTTPVVLVTCNGAKLVLPEGSFNVRVGAPHDVTLNENVNGPATINVDLSQAHPHLVLAEANNVRRTVVCS